MEQDGPKYYPKLLKYVRIKVIEASSTILAPFDKSLQEEAITQMNRNVEFKDPNIYRLLPERFKLVELLLDSSVKEVTAKQILLNDGNVIDYGTYSRTRLTHSTTEHPPPFIVVIVGCIFSSLFHFSLTALYYTFIYLIWFLSSSSSFTTPYTLCY